MRRSGELVQWNDDRGFGFVRDNDGERYFVHISDIRRAETRPQPGHRLSFSPGLAADGRPVARSAVLLDVASLARPAPISAPRRPAPSMAGPLLRLLAAAAIVALAAIAAPTWVLIGYLVLGTVSMACYWADKDAAENGRWRIRERDLHRLDLLGGVAGGLVAQAVLRHKVRKPGFAAGSWLIVTLHLSALLVLLLGPWR